MKKFAKTFKDDLELNIVLNSEYEFLISVEEVALGYGVTLDTVLDSYKKDLTKSGYYTFENTTYLTKEGVVKLGKRFKSARAIKFRNWFEKLTFETHKINIDKNMLKYYEVYGSLNPNATFTITYKEQRVKAYRDEGFSFFISTPELAKLLGVGTSTVRAQKVYHEKRLRKGIHYVKLGKNNWWTREGAIYISLRSKNEDIGNYLLNDELLNSLVTNN